MRRGIVLTLVLGAALTGCGDAISETAEQAVPAVPAASPTAMVPAQGPVRARATVLDDGEGPMLTAQDLDGGEGSLEVELAMNDPKLTVLNVGVTDDVARAEDAVRAVWGGALCVSEFANTHDRLRQVANQLADLPAGLDRGYGSISNTVEISVVHDDGSIQAWADEEFGPGVVTVTSALEPVE